MGKFVIIKYIAEFLLSFWLAYLFAQIGNIWIKKLYTNNKKLLSFTIKSVYSKKRVYFVTLMMLIIFLRMAFQQDIWRGMLQIFVGYMLVLIIYTDFEQQIIFDKMIICLIILAGLDCFYYMPLLMDRLLAGFGGAAVFFLLTVLLRGAIGGGDIKLIFALGLLLGEEKLLIVVISGIFLGAFAAGILLLMQQIKRNDYFAYGPYFAVPALIMYILL